MPVLTDVETGLEAVDNEDREHDQVFEERS
jgi:hypothetical protein